MARRAPARGPCRCLGAVRAGAVERGARDRCRAPAARALRPGPAVRGPDGGLGRRPVRCRRRGQPRCRRNADGARRGHPRLAQWLGADRRDPAAAHRGIQRLVLANAADRGLVRDHRAGFAVCGALHGARLGQGALCSNRKGVVRRNCAGCGPSADWRSAARPTSASLSMPRCGSGALPGATADGLVWLDEQQPGAGTLDMLVELKSQYA